MDCAVDNAQRCQISAQSLGLKLTLESSQSRVERTRSYLTSTTDGGNKLFLSIYRSLIFSSQLFVACFRIIVRWQSLPGSRFLPFRRRPSAVGLHALWPKGRSSFSPPDSSRTLDHIFLNDLDFSRCTKLADTFLSILGYLSSILGFGIDPSATQWIDECAGQALEQLLEILVRNPSVVIPQNKTDSLGGNALEDDLTIRSFSYYPLFVY